MILDDDDQFGNLYDLICRGERLPEYEHIISQNPGYSCYYAMFAVRGRWPEAEKTILEDPYFSMVYKEFLLAAEDIMGRPLVVGDRLPLKWFKEAGDR